MPQPTPKLEAHSRGDQILQHTAAAARLLLKISDDDSNNPYLKSIAGISLLLVETVQTVKSNKSQCISMLGRIHEIVSAVINICEDGSGALSPTILRNLSQFFDTLQKVHAFVRSQVDVGLFRRVLRHAETAALLQDCNAGLQHAIDVFGIQTTLGTAVVIGDTKKDWEVRHGELLELLQQRNDSESTFSLHQSSISSLDLLPSSPKIFYGRDNQLNHLLEILLGPDPVRTAILGPGGIGKSSLALAVLHHPKVVSRFGTQRYFVSLESSTSALDMFTAIAAYFNVDPTGKVSRAIVCHLCGLSMPCLLVLDNLEDCWENQTSRGEVEDFLSLLSEVPHLHLMVTMRGAERPGKVKWSRPFLPALDRLDDMAARQTFLDIVDEADDDELSSLLSLTDNLPLAITLLANITSFEGAQSVLDRWVGETTTLLSEGFNKQTNLNKSITISLSSPRLLSEPHALELLSLMSLLPDGTMEPTLWQMNLAFSAHIARSKTTLLRCSLIYVAADGRLRTLAPIREYVRERHPPNSDSFDGLRSYFYDLASLFPNPTELPNRELVHRLSSEFSNARAVTAYALSKSLSLTDTVRCTIDLVHFNTATKTASFDLSEGMDRAVEDLGNISLKGEYLLAKGRVQVGRSNCVELVSAALRCFEETEDLFGQARSLYTLASHLTLMGRFQSAIEMADRGARIAQQSGEVAIQALCTTASSKAHRNKGDLRTALVYARTARRLAQASGNLTVEASVTQQYASCCVMVGDYAHASELCAAIMSMLSVLGLAAVNVHAYKNVLNVSAEIFDRRTEYVAARALRVRIYKARREIDEMPKAWDLLNLALIDVELGDLGAARANAETARRLVSPAVWTASGLDILNNILEGDFHFHAKECDKAIQSYRGALGNSEWVDLGIIALEKLSNMALRTDDRESAIQFSTLLLANAMKTHDLAGIQQALRRLGDLFLLDRDETTATSLYQVAEEGFKLMSIHRGRGDCLLRMGDVYSSRGETAKAREMWFEALPLFEKSSQTTDIASCNKRLALTINFAAD
ncbi:hypothetical protein C8R43DRAFT_1195033 [Mycena crocata]|nr:hypothetical protein C8R43DRAFT_1195033 [Mycena crocata]